MFIRAAVKFSVRWRTKIMDNSFQPRRSTKAQNVSADFVQFVFFVALLLHFTEVLRYFLRLLLRLTW